MDISVVYENTQIALYLCLSVPPTDQDAFISLIVIVPVYVPVGSVSAKENVPCVVMLKVPEMVFPDVRGPVVKKYCGVVESVIG